MSQAASLRYVAGNPCRALKSLRCLETPHVAENLTTWAGRSAAMEFAVIEFARTNRACALTNLIQQSIQGDAHFLVGVVRAGLDRRTNLGDAIFALRLL